MEQKTFNFRIISAKHIFNLFKSLILCFGAIILLLVIDLKFYTIPDDILEKASIAAMSILVLNWINSIYKIIQSYRKGKETVIFTDLDMQSKVYGIIPYETIASYTIDQKYSWLNWGNPVPELNIRLKNNQIISYNLYTKSKEEGKKQTDEFFNFILKFMECLKNYENQKQASKTYLEAMRKMGKARERNNNPPIYLMAILLFVLSILYFLMGLR